MALKQVKLLGEGAFGKCYLCENPEDGSKWVVKQVDISGMDAQEKKEAYHEAKVMGGFDHPNIIRFKNVYTTTNGKLNIVMDYADGGDLAQKLKAQRGRPLPEKEIIDLFVQVCLALKHVHDRKVLHRDLKTQNVFLTRAGMVKLGDFGIAKVLSSTVDKARTMAGTPYYLSPEIIENQPYSFKSDVWALGVLLYELCALKPPFDGSSLQHLALRIVRGKYAPIPPQYSRDLKTLVAQLLLVESNRRPTVAQILRMPFIKSRIHTVLSESIRSKEFTHSFLQQPPPPSAPARPRPPVISRAKNPPVKNPPIKNIPKNPPPEPVRRKPDDEPSKPKLYRHPELADPELLDEKYGPRKPPSKNIPQPPSEFQGGLEDIFKRVEAPAKPLPREPREPPREPPKRPARPSVLNEVAEKLRLERAKKRDDVRSNMRADIQKKREEARKAKPVEDSKRSHIFQDMPDLKKLQETLDQSLNAATPKDATRKPDRDEIRKKMREDKLKYKQSKGPDAPELEIRFISGAFTNNEGQVLMNKDRERYFQELQNLYGDPSQETEEIPEENAEELPKAISEEVPKAIPEEISKEIAEEIPEEIAGKNADEERKIIETPGDSTEPSEEIVDQDDELEGQIILPMERENPSSYSAIELLRHDLEDRLGFEALIKVYTAIKELDSQGESSDDSYASLESLVPPECSHYIQWVHSLVMLENRAEND